jgi:SNF2 family DNA or RNA helicase
VGLAWLVFLRQWGLGACLADDMGLGKTIQLIALLLHERINAQPRPALLICPTSVVGNWQRELTRFAPDLRVLIHHGALRKKDDLSKQAARHDVVISSYALLHRDEKHLSGVEWSDVILDEAQNIKNPSTKQAQAARKLTAQWRVALTGTPVENRLTELWSIFQFLNPGYLGSQQDFLNRLARPIERGGDEAATQQLKSLVGPFILRRVKTDPAVISDLPEKNEMKVYCSLTKEQATLYQAVVEDSLFKIQEAEGIDRRGVILGTLMKLKQVCNHPAQFLGDGSTLANRSGKLMRLTEMLEEARTVRDHALVFTQFAAMGSLLKTYLQDAFGEEVFFLHGGTPMKARTKMVETFQNDPHSPLIFILSIKAGGTGLNLTRANHVFHFDRWWNPAVENQATDRAFRIGQTKNVQVHKYLCAGTFEEKIDDMIERKQALAESIVGTSEGWITELSTDQLKDLFALRKEAVGD